MKTQRQKAIDWWNTIGATKQNELALDYYGSTLLMDDEVEFIWLRTVPQEIIYTEAEVRQMVIRTVDKFTTYFHEELKYKIAEEWFNKIKK